MAELAGKSAKLKVNKSEVEVARDGAPDIESNLHSITAFGDDAEKRLKGVLDTTVEIEALLEASPSTPITDLRDSALNGTSVDIEYSPDAHTSSGPTDVYKFTILVSSFSLSSSTGSEQTVSATCENSDGTKVTIAGTFT